MFCFKWFSLVEGHHYHTLGVPITASTRHIRKAFRDLARKYHPDKTTQNKAWAEEKFKKISQAYEILRDPKKRLEYDLKNEFRYPDIFKKEKWWEDESFEPQSRPGDRKVRSPVGFVTNWKSVQESRNEPHRIMVPKNERLPRSFWFEIRVKIQGWFRGKGSGYGGEAKPSTKVRAYRSRYVKMDDKKPPPRKVRQPKG